MNASAKTTRFFTSALYPIRSSRSFSALLRRRTNNSHHHSSSSRTSDMEIIRNTNTNTSSLPAQPGSNPLPHEQQYHRHCESLQHESAGGARASPMASKVLTTDAQIVTTTTTNPHHFPISSLRRAPVPVLVWVLGKK